MSEFVFIQLASVNDYEIVNEHILSCAYIEHADMSGTKLLMQLYNPHAIYDDHAKLTHDSVINITFGDPNGRDEEQWQVDFVVNVVKSENDTLQIEAYDLISHRLKQVADTPLFLVDQGPKSLLSQLCPDTIISAPNAAHSTYHLHVGQARSKLLRRIARDYGAAIYVSRNQICMRLLRELPQSHDITLESDNPNAIASINKITKHGEKSLYNRIYHKKYFTWDVCDGMQQATRHTQKAAKFVHVKSDQLDNLSLALYPVLDVELLGNDSFVPLMPVQVLLHKMTDTHEHDESIPSLLYITRVTHYRKGQSYLCKLELSALLSNQ